MLFVGATGSGKSTSLAAMIDYRNSHTSGHIVTIEDPVEFVHRHKKSIVNQREVGVDTRSWHNALKNTLRQAPDVILIGEIRDRETMEHAIAFAETGHLCISTLHANNANQALDRIINFFPEEKRQQLLMDLSLNLQAFVSQRLIPNTEGGRSAAVEVMLGSPTIKELILRGDIGGLKEIMEKSKDRGMKTFDMALFDLCEAGEITEAEALRNADSENNVRLRLKLSGDQPAAGRKDDFQPRGRAALSLKLAQPVPAAAVCQRLSEAGLALQNIDHIALNQCYQLRDGQFSELNAIAVRKDVAVLIEIAHRNPRHDGRLSIMKSQPGADRDLQLQYGFAVKGLLRADGMAGIV